MTSTRVQVEVLRNPLTRDAEGREKQLDDSLKRLTSLKNALQGWIMWF